MYERISLHLSEVVNLLRAGSLSFSIIHRLSREKSDLLLSCTSRVETSFVHSMLVMDHLEGNN
jgi:hypothetical protein